MGFTFIKVAIEILTMLDTLHLNLINFVIPFLLAAVK